MVTTKKTGYFLRVNDAQKYHGAMCDIREMLAQLLRANTNDLLEVVNASSGRIERKYKNGAQIY